MARLCSAPVPAGEAHEIPDGGRVVTVHVDLDWGAADLRDTFSKTYEFCSFECATRLFDEWAGKHDGHVLVHGQAPEGDDPA